MKNCIRVLVSLLGVVLISTLVLAQQQKPKLIEYVLTAGGFDPVNGYTYVPADQGNLEDFVSSPQLTVHVPPSPLSDAVFFEFTGQYWWSWGPGAYRIFNTGLNLAVKSPVIPAGISVSTGGAGTEIADVNLAGVSTGQNRFTRTSKIRMERNTYLTGWTSGFDVLYTANNEAVPQNEAIRIINRLMNTGFDLEFCVRGSVRGVRYVKNTQITVEITRLAAQK